MRATDWNKNYDYEDACKKAKKDFEQKEKENFYNNQKNNYSKKEKESVTFLYATLLSVQEIKYNKQFNIIGNLLDNQLKINNILSMPENKCLQIESSDGFFINIISKNNILHMSAEEKNMDFKMIIEKVLNKSQLNAFATFFKSPLIIREINSLLELPVNNLITYTIEGVDIYAFKQNDYFVFSGVKP